MADPATAFGLVSRIGGNLWEENGYDNRLGVACYRCVVCWTYTKEHPRKTRDSFLKLFGPCRDVSS